MTQAIARLNIILDYVTPEVSRKLDVPFGIRLDQLHLALQAAMGWSNSHLYMFLFKRVSFGIPDPEWDNGHLDARKATLDSVIEDVGGKTFKYIYDFGDDWCHTIKIERVITADPLIPYPYLIGGTGRCPPEDIGGPPGYEEFLEAMADPKHERHDEMIQWWGEPFDPKAVDPAKIGHDLAKLHRAWNKTKKAKPSATIKH